MNRSIIGKVFRNKKYDYFVSVTGENNGIIHWKMIKLDSVPFQSTSGGARRDLFLDSFNEVEEGHENQQENKMG